MTAMNIKSQADMRMDRCSLRGYGLQTVLIPGCLKKAKKGAPEDPPGAPSSGLSGNAQD